MSILTASQQAIDLRKYLEAELRHEEMVQEHRLTAAPYAQQVALAASATKRIAKLRKALEAAKTCQLALLDIAAGKTSGPSA